MQRKRSIEKQGARGLRTILEEIMLDIMYDAPSQENLVEVVIDEASVLNGCYPQMCLQRCIRRELTTTLTCGTTSNRYNIC